LITNKSEETLSIKEAMLAHKNQYKCEHINKRAKSSLNLEPIYLHTPERIETMLFLFKIALQMVVLIEKTARANVKSRDRGLDGKNMVEAFLDPEGLYPGRQPVNPGRSWRPSTPVFSLF
jgi:transposase